jgi:hypothetical protein
VKNIDRFFDKVPGSYFGLASGLLSLLILVLATLLHSITEPITPFSHFISSLGVGPNGARLVFSIGIPLSGAIAIPYFVYLSRFLWSKNSEEGGARQNIVALAGLIAAIASVVGLFILCIFDLSHDKLSLHAVGSAIFFSGAVGAVVLYTITTVMASKGSRPQVAMGVAVIVICLLMAGSAALSDASAESLTETGPEHKWARFFQWLSVITIDAWLIVMSLHTLRLEQGTDEPEEDPAF